MTTSGTYSFTVTRDDIIYEAMVNIGKLGEGETPTPTQTNDCARKLNMMCKQWMGKADFAPGLKMFTRRHSDLFLSISTGQYNVGPTGDHWTSTSYTQQTTANAAAAATSISVPNANMTVGDHVGIVLDSGVLYWTTVSTKVSTTGITIPAPGLPTQASGSAYVFNYTTKAQQPLLIETCVLRDINNNDTDIRIFTLQEYDYLPSKVNTLYISDPTAIYYEDQLSNGVLYTDVAGSSDTTKRLHISYMEEIQDFNNPLDSPEFSKEWYRPLCWGLTKEIGPMFNFPFTRDMQDNLTEALAIAKNKDPEVSRLYFQPGLD